MTKDQKLISLLKKDDYGTLVVEHKDRLTRFGFNYLEQFVEKYIEVVNLTQDQEEDIVQDFVSIITSFWDKKISKNKVIKLIEELKQE